MSIIEIKSKIASVAVVKEVASEPAVAPSATIMSENVKRPRKLLGATYAIESDKAKFYITINDIVLDEGTEFEVRRPFELFIASKDTSSFAWITTLSRMVSAVMRKGGDITFMIEEFKSVRDPEGGYWSYGTYMGSLQAHIGAVLEEHFRELGMLEQPVAQTEEEAPSTAKEEETKANASQCPKCYEFTYVMQEGCAICTSCNYSKCG